MLTENLELRFETALDEVAKMPQKERVFGLSQALAWASVVRYFSGASPAWPDSARKLREEARRTLLQASTLRAGLPDGEGDFLIAYLREGVEALSNGAPKTGDSDSFAPATHPLAADLRCALVGEGDAFRAADTIRHLRRCASCAAALSLLTELSPGVETVLRAAAKTSSGVRSPMEGRSLGVVTRFQLEAVFFADADATRVAFYAESPVTIQVNAGGVHFESSDPGYWIGRIDSVSPIALAITVGTETENWMLAF